MVRNTYNDENHKAKKGANCLFAECAEESCHSSASIEKEVEESKYTDLIFDLS